MSATENPNSNKDRPTNHTPTRPWFVIQGQESVTATLEDTWWCDNPPDDVERVSRIYSDCFGAEVFDKDDLPTTYRTKIDHGNCLRERCLGRS